MSRFITLAQDDPKMMDHLMGTFSDSERALPLQSLNATTNRAIVTFNIVPIREIKTPAFFSKWARILKIHHGLLPAVGVYLVLTQAEYQQRSWDPGLAILSLIVLILMVTAMSIRNDVNDHISGLDRLLDSNDRRPLQLGWVTAKSAQRWSTIFLVTGVLAGIPVVLAGTWLVPLVGAVAVGGVTLVSFKKMGRPYRLWTEIAVFFLLGPMLTVGFSEAVGLAANAQTLCQGLLMGWFAVLLLHLKNFSSLMVTDQLGLMNSMTILGFEKGKRWLDIWFGGFVVFQLIDHVFFAPLSWTVGFAALSFLFWFLFHQQIKLLRSPVGSQFRQGLQDARRISFLLLSVWILEQASYMLVAELRP